MKLGDHLDFHVNTAPTTVTEVLESYLLARLEQIKLCKTKIIIIKATVT